MPITTELLDELLKDYKSPEDMFGDDRLLQQLTKAVVERVPGRDDLSFGL